MQLLRVDVILQKGICRDFRAIDIITSLNKKTKNQKHTQKGKLL